MRKLTALTGCASLMLGGIALAGLNPEFPLLPNAIYTGVTGAKANNQGSAMCVDCHTRLPQTVGATHFVSATLASDTLSSGGWTTVETGRRADLRRITEASQYFAYRVNDGGTGNYWTSGGYSKYWNGANSVIVPSAVADIGDNVLATTTADTANPDYFTSIAGIASPAAYDLICESCHSVTTNVAGGNNILAAVTDGATQGQSGAATEATLCVGCHGFMYSANVSGTAPQAAIADVTTANTADAHWGDYRNFSAGTTRRGNNEDHYINGVLYDMNHHVMTGDNINVAKISRGYGWRDVLVISADAVRVTSNASAVGQYPVDGSWQDYKEWKSTTAANFNCINCHGPGHGSRGGTEPLQASVLTGASILLDSTAALSNAGNRIQRLSESPRGWMSPFDDNAYCGNCHHIPGQAANSQ